MIPISQWTGTEFEKLEKLKGNIGFGIHVALPCIVQSYDVKAQTVEVQPTIRERIQAEDGKISYVQYPMLINVPVIFPRAGGYSILFPVTKGDECLVVFSDLSIDNWWLKGNVQNPVEQRRHDLSDGFAILGLINQFKLAGKQTGEGISMQSPGNSMLEVRKDDVFFKCSSGSTFLSALLAAVKSCEDRLTSCENRLSTCESRLSTCESELKNHEDRIAALERRI